MIRTILSFHTVVLAIFFFCLIEADAHGVVVGVPFYSTFFALANCSALGRETIRNWGFILGCTLGQFGKGQEIEYIDLHGKQENIENRDEESSVATDRLRRASGKKKKN
jgi:hypothetical protein